MNIPREIRRVSIAVDCLIVERIGQREAQILAEDALEIALPHRGDILETQLQTSRLTRFGVAVVTVKAPASAVTAADFASASGSADVVIVAVA